MKRLTSLVITALAMAVAVSTTQAAPWYFDQNDNAAGSGVAAQAYNWTTDGSGAAPAFWNTNNADGTQANPGLNVSQWVNGNDAVFSAGSDAAGVRYLLNIGGGTTAGSALIEEGTVVINSGTFDTGAGTTEVLVGATLETNAQNQFNAGGVLKLSGGRLLDTNPSTTAQVLLSPAKTIEINGTGTIEFNHGAGSQVQSNISGNVITGTGGTSSTGGAGTLVKSGSDVILYAGADTGGGHFSWEQNSFAKLVVKGGSFRINRVLVLGVGYIDERLFGAVPLNTLPDAITLDGGGIGATQAVTLDARRGIMITANGGFFDQGGAASINVPGPVTAAPGALLTIGNSGSIAPNNAPFEFSNPNNVITFQGNLSMLRGTLQLDSSLNVAHFSGLGVATTNFGTVRIAGGTTLTVGSDNLDASFDGSIADLTSGAGSGGIFTKVGSGTLTLNTENSASAAWANTGGVNINNGTIKYASLKAGFTDTKPVSIGATGKLNMSGITDTIGSLSGPAGAIVDMKDTASAAGALTFAATAGSTTYSGTIIGGGNLTKAGTASTAVQILAGNTTLGAVAVNAGMLRTNATMTTSGGVAVASAGTLGGTGTIVGTVTNNGIIAPGDAGVGTLSVTGNLTDGASSHWAIELSGSTSDKIAVSGNINLTAVDSLDVTGAGSGTSWLIGTYTGTLTGAFDNVTAPYTVSYAGGNILLNAPPTGLLGDFNNDGKVDAADYCTWKKNEGTNNALVNDNGLGTPIGSDHYNLWRANFGQPPGAGSGGELCGTAVVPEPSTAALLVMGIVALAVRFRGEL
jgi:hypothetical protein